MLFNRFWAYYRTCKYSWRSLLNLSIKFVFTQKKKMDQKKEFTVFLILSAIGLVINEIVMFVCIDGIYAHSLALKDMISDKLMVSIAAIIATGIVMVYNFISRKLFLERK